MERKTSRRKPAEEATRSTAKAPVTLRLGDLETDAEERAAGAPRGSVVRRDLARYYRLMRNYEIHGLGVDGADPVVHPLGGFDDAVNQYMVLASKPRGPKPDLHMGLGAGLVLSPTPSQIPDTEIDCDCRGLCSPQLRRG
jgi:hypothetical protein